MSTAADSRPDQAPATNVRRGHAALAGLLLAASTLVLDFFIVLACLPTLTQALDARKADLQLLLTAYAVANAALLPLAGRMGDAFGKARVFRWSAVAFAAFAIAGAASTGMVMLVLMRLGQGLAAALMQAQILALLSTGHAPAERARVFGWYTACLGASGVLGQVVGGIVVGWLPAAWSWRACIALAAPCMLLAAVLSRSLPIARPPGRVPLDVSGGLLGGAALAAAIFTLTIGREAGWPAWSAGTALSAVLFAWLFVARIRRRHRAGQPALVPPSLVANRAFLLACAAIVAFYGSVSSFYFLLTLELRIVQGFSALQTAGVFAWLGSCFFAAAASGRLKRAVGRHWLVAGAAALCGGHLLMLGFANSLTGSALSAALMLSCLAQGVGLGVLMGPLVSAAVGHVAPEDAGVGAGLSSAAQHTGNALGVCAVGFLFTAEPGFGSGLAGAVSYLVGCLLLMAFLLRPAPLR
jgi:MFS family permease